MFQRWSLVVSLLFCIFLGGSSGFWPFDFLGGLQVLGFEDEAPNVKQVAIIGMYQAHCSISLKKFLFREYYNLKTRV
jgi:hypothetical protein